MAKFFLGDLCLPPVLNLRDVFDYGKALNTRGLPVLLSEERFLRQVTWCMLQIENDQEEGELFQALTRIAALTLAIIEDEDLSIPEGYAIGPRANLESLALQFHQGWRQNELSLAAAMGIHQLEFETSDDLAEVAKRLVNEDSDEPLRRAFLQGEVFLRQGEGIFSRHTEDAKREAHRLRIDAARERLRLLIARLFAIPLERDPTVLRAQLVRRELRHVELDSLGAQRISAAEQERQTRHLLKWTEADLGEELTNENKAELSAQLRDLAAAESDLEDDGAGDEEGWLFGMD